MRKDGPGSIGRISLPKEDQRNQIRRINSMADIPPAPIRYSFPERTEPDITRTSPDKGFMEELSDEFRRIRNSTQQNLIMTPAYKKQQARCENEIKRLDDLIKDAKAKGDDDAVARFEAQKELYQQQIEDCQRKIEEEQANALDPKNGLDGGNTDVDALRQADEEANLEAERQELLEQLEAAEKQETAVAGEKEKLSEPNFNAE